MRRWAQRPHLAALLALAVAACARGEHVPVGGGIAVTDDVGRRVTLAAPPRRIVSLLPSFTEILFAIGAGDRLVGRTTWWDYPPQGLAVPTAGAAPPIVIGAGSYLDRLAALAGARNVFHDVGSPSAQVSIETIAARDPDFVAVLSDSASPEPPRYASRPEWRVVRAVRERRFVFLPGQLFGRPGPPAAEAIRDLRRRLQAAP